MTEKEIQRVLFPDDYIAWLILEIDKCDDTFERLEKEKASSQAFTNLIMIKTTLLRARDAYQKLILNRR